MKTLSDELKNKLEDLAKNIKGVKNINMKFENEDPFFNINTKDDLKKAMEKLEK